MVPMISRRQILASALASHLGGAQRQAQISITIDLEMARHYPAWSDTEWDFEKGNLSAEVKRYALEAARRVKQRGGVIHFFLVGRVLEQPDISWLQEIVKMGHPIGNSWYSLAPDMGPRPAEPTNTPDARYVLDAERIPQLVPPSVIFPYKKMGQ